MTSRSGQIWFVAGYRMANGKPKKIVPVTRDGWMTFVIFAVGEAVAMLAGFALIYAMPEMMVVGIVVMIAGLALAIGYLSLMIYRHTDFSVTRDEFRALQASPT